MKVALDLQPCCGEKSGIGYYTYELARRMYSDESIDFSGNIYDFIGKGCFADKLCEIPAELKNCPWLPYWIYHRIWHKIPIRYEMLFPEADVTHFFNYIVPTRIKGKVFTTIHDITYARYPETVNERGLQFLKKELDRSIDRSDRIIVNSEFVRGEVVSYFGVDPDRIRVICPAAQIGTTALTEDDLLEKWNLEKGYILFVGNIEPRKNLDRLIDAYKLLKREAGITQKLVIAGGSGWKSEDTKIKAANTEGCLLTGYVSEEEKVLLYKNAGVLAYVSLYEGFGMPVLEGMHYNLPVVCSNVASLPEVAGSAARFVDPLDTVSIAEGLYDVLSHESLRSEMVEKGIRNIQRYSWDLSADRLRKVYLEFK